MSAMKRSNQTLVSRRADCSGEFHYADDDDDDDDDDGSGDDVYVNQTLKVMTTDRDCASCVLHRRRHCANDVVSSIYNNSLSK